MASATQHAATQTSIATMSSDASTRCPIPQACQTVSGITSAPARARAMAFKNEVVSDEDIERYNLPFPKGEGRWWTRDAERDYYLWGGLVGNLAFDSEQEGLFYLYADGTLYDVNIQPAEDRKDNITGEFIICWDKIAEITPEPENQTEIIAILKSALRSFGHDGRRNIFHPSFRVEFGF